EAAAAQRRVGHRENGMLALPGQQIELDAARFQAVEELIALRGASKSQARLRLTPALQILQREVADPKVADEPAFAQLRQRPQGFVEWMRPGPVQQVQIQIAAAQPLDRVLAGTHRAAQRRVRGLDLADEKQLLACRSAGAADAKGRQRLPEQPLGAALPVDLGGIKYPVAKLQGTRERGQLARA